MGDAHDLFRCRRHLSIGEVHYPGVETDAGFHSGGHGEMVWGTKFVIIAAQHPEPHSRFILDVACIETSGAEAATALDRFVGLAPLVPGAQGVVYDTAFRGVHHQRLMRDLGWGSRDGSAACERRGREAQVQPGGERATDRAG